MPNLGAGVDQHVNVGAVPTWVFSPTAGLPNTVRLYNEGAGGPLVYVGGANVSPLNGLPLSPGNEPLRLVNITGPVYACSAVSPGTAAATIGTGVPSNAGTTKFSVTTMNTSFAAGTVLLVGGGTSQEVLVVASTAGTVITTTTSSLYDHAVGAPLTACTYFPAQLRATAGAI